MAFAVGAGEFAHGCVDSQLLVLPGVGLVVVWTIRPIGRNEVAKGLKIHFTFPCGTEDAVPKGQQWHRLGRVHIGGL